jgi:prephenate dehydrogenase
MPDSSPAAAPPEHIPTRVVIVGAGLLGGSLLAALQPRRRASDAPLHLTAVSSTHTLDALRSLHWCDALVAHAQLTEACANADLVLLCTPLLTIRAQVDTIAAARHQLAPGAIVSDVGSTKREICAHAFAAFPDDVPHAPRFVGGHPMAGSERSGLAAADPLLYQSALWVLCPPDDLDAARLTTLRTLVHAVGARSAVIDPVTHDAAVARISHVPQLVSSALAGWAGSDEQLSATALTLAAGGFRDMTRLALSPFEVWADIVATNRTPIAEGLHELSARLGVLAASLRDGAEPTDTDALQRAFTSGRAFRQQFHMPRKGILHDLSEFVVKLDDRPGQLLALFTPLADAGINVADLEILKVREGESGTVLMGFGTPAIAADAKALLARAGFTIFER